MQKNVLKFCRASYEFDVGHTVYVFCGRRVKISIIHNYNLTENFGAVGINFRLRRGEVNLPNSGGGEVKFPIFHSNNVTEKIANVELSFRFFCCWGRLGGYFSQLKANRLFL